MSATSRRTRRGRSSERGASIGASLPALIGRPTCATPPFVYRCPKTDLNVQGWVADDPTEGEGETYADIGAAEIGKPP
jgi:hypothetical protein